MNETEYCNGCELIFDHYGEENQLNKLIEECSELIRAISRKDKVNILEEVADVQVLIVLTSSTKSLAISALFLQHRIKIFFSLSVKCII